MCDYLPLLSFIYSNCESVLVILKIRTTPASNRADIHRLAAYCLFGGSFNKLKVQDKTCVHVCKLDKKEALEKEGKLMWVVVLLQVAVWL